MIALVLNIYPCLKEDMTSVFSKVILEKRKRIQNLAEEGYPGYIIEAEVNSGDMFVNMESTVKGLKIMPVKVHYDKDKTHFKLYITPHLATPKLTINLTRKGAKEIYDGIREKAKESKLDITTGSFIDDAMVQVVRKTKGGYDNLSENDKFLDIRPDGIGVNLEYKLFEEKLELLEYFVNNLFTVAN